MCYSAQLKMRFKSLQEMLKAEADYASFQRVFEARLSDDSIKIPKAVEANFYTAKTPAEKRIKDLIIEYQISRTKKLEAELFKQKKRFADAERRLKESETKKALEDKRISSNKIKWNLKKIADLKRTEIEDRDSRIFPHHYAPVVIMEGKDAVIMPMRYLCRQAGKPVEFDDIRKGCYNARRDNLERFWKKQFAHTHAVIVVESFYEHVARHDFEHRELREGEEPEDMVIHFNPKGNQDMLVACLWSHWTGPGERDLDSFAAITDEPPPEVAAAGHDRCIIPLEPSNVSMWLRPEDTDIPTLYKLLDDRERPYYQHELAA